MVKFILAENDGKEQLLASEKLGSDEMTGEITKILNAKHKDSPRVNVKYQIKEQDSGEIALDSSMMVPYPC